MNSRKFYVLCIEDEEEIRDYLFSELQGLSNDKIEITFAESRDEASSFLQNDFFYDYITLDLTIPITTGSFEKSSSNGLGLLGEVKEKYPGTPVLVLTGTSTVKMMQQFLLTSNNVDIWYDDRDMPTVSHLEKSNIFQFLNNISPCISSVLALNDIELSYSFENLPIAHDRLIRIFAKKNNAEFVKIEVIGGGYSDAKVYALVLNDRRGRVLHRCIAKCGSRKDIDIDSDNFSRLISMLKPEATPRKIDHIRYGAGINSAVFYGLATEHKYSLFSACNNGVMSLEVLYSLENILSNWHGNDIEERRQIKDIRRSLLSDESADRLTSIYGIDEATSFEENYAQCRVSYIHGDLHGENILVDIDNGVTTLIDYGDVKEECTILDPLTLECSFLFHANSPCGDWPTISSINEWCNLENYIKDCPYSREIQFCRDWTDKVGVGNRELAACLYSYALRQLKYPDTDKDIAIKLIRIAFDLYDRS